MTTSKAKEEADMFPVKELPKRTRCDTQGRNKRSIPTVSTYVAVAKFPAAEEKTSMSSIPRTPSISPKTSTADFQSAKPTSTAASTAGPKETASTATGGTATAETQ